MSVFHIAALHQYGSTNPLGLKASTPGTFGLSSIGVFALACVASTLVFFYPDLLGHPDNMIPANPYSTPQHIVPEWYYLWVYAILRSIPNKAMGVAAIGLTFAALASQPFLSTPQVGSGIFRPVSEWLFWTLVAYVGLLTWVGTETIMPATVLLGQVCTAYLGFYLLMLKPMVGWLEQECYLRLADFPRIARDGCCADAE